MSEQHLALGPSVPLQHSPYALVKLVDGRYSAGGVIPPYSTGSILIGGSLPLAPSLHRTAIMIPCNIDIHVLSVPNNSHISEKTPLSLAIFETALSKA